jgi:uncharacterized protein (DUF433 family)
MTHFRWQDYIIIDPEVHHGDPCIKGTRIPISMIMGSLADGLAPEEILVYYPQLTRQAIQAVLAYAAELMQQEALAPLAV